MSDNQNTTVTTIKNLYFIQAFLSMSIRGQRDYFEDYLRVIYYAQPHYILMVNGGACLVRKNSNGRYYIEYTPTGTDIQISDMEEFLSPTTFMLEGYTFECELLMRVLSHTK